MIAELARTFEDFRNHNDPARLKGEVNRLKKLINRLLLENAQLRKENRQLRRALRDKDMRLLRQAEMDAILIGGLYFAGLSTSRRACQAVGIGHRHWRRAVALLQVGRAHDGTSIVAATVEDFERAIRTSKERVERDGMETIAHRMPPCYKR